MDDKLDKKIGDNVFFEFVDLYKGEIYDFIVAFIEWLKLLFA